MSLIGIFTQKSHENYLKQELGKTISDEQLFFLKEDSLQNLKNIKFQTILIGKDINKNKEQMREIAKKADYLILNTDIAENLSALSNLSFKLITYGFHSKATITASSVEENKTMVCLQRAIKNVQGKTIEPQEQTINSKLVDNSYAVMELFSLKALYNFTK